MHTPTLVVSLILAAAVSLLTALIVATPATEQRPSVVADAPATDAPATDGAGLQVELEQLRDRLEALEGASRSAEAPQRTRTADGLRDEVAVIVAELLAERTEELAASDAAAPTSFNVHQAVAEITELSSSSARYNELWEQIRKDGRADEMVAAFEARAAELGTPDSQVELAEAYVQRLLGAKDVMAQSRDSMAADACYDKALEMEPTHWDARFNKAVSYTFWPDFMGKKAEAIKHFEILVEQQEQRAPQSGYDQTYVILGNLLEQRGDNEAAAAMWSRGAKLHPDSDALRGKGGR